MGHVDEIAYGYYTKKYFGNLFKHMWGDVKWEHFKVPKA